ncbi:MAG: acyl-CoA dehydrogenase family protein [Acetobacteraceae bacterium]
MDDVTQTPAADGLVSAAACLERARGLIPLLRAAAPRIEQKYELPPDVLDAMHDAGLFRLLLPRAYGGYELKPSDYVQCVEAIAQGDASTAWCMNQGSGCSMASAYLAPEIAREVWGDKRAVLAWGQGPGARAVRADGGWRVTGTWNFVSGLRHATWFGAMAPCYEPDGTPIRHSDGKAWERTMLLPRERATIQEDWRVMGLRGTGSDRFSVEDMFIDDAHSLTREYAPERREQGPLYRFQAMQLYAGGFACVGLGTARAMVDAFIELAKGKTQAWSTEPLRDNHAVQYAIGYADGALKAARAGLLKVLDDVWDDVARVGEITIPNRVAVRQASTFAIHTARDVVHQIYHEAGSTAIFDNQPFERRLRDMNSVSQQMQGRRTHLETVGLYLLGGEPNARWL